MDVPGHSSRPPFSRRWPQPSPTPTRIPRVVPRLIREGWFGGAIGALVAPRDGTPGTAGAAAAGDDAPDDGDVQGAHGHSTPRTFTEEELRDADPRLQRLTAADRQLLGIFGDRIHLNDGTHLAVGSVSTNVPASRRAVKPLGSCPFKLSAVKQCFCLPPNHSAVQPLRIDRQTITPLHAVGQLDHQPLKMSSGPAAELLSRPAWQPGVQFSREPSRRLPSCKPLGSQPPTVSCKCG